MIRESGLGQQEGSQSATSVSHMIEKLVADSHPTVPYTLSNASVSEGN